MCAPSLQIKHLSAQESTSSIIWISIYNMKQCRMCALGNDGECACKRDALVLCRGMYRCPTQTQKCAHAHTHTHQLFSVALENLHICIDT